MPHEEEGKGVTFERPLPVQMMAIDGTWRRSCALKEVSEVGATLQVESGLDGLSLNEFFLVLSSFGLAYRRCQLEGVNGEQLQVTFLRPGKKTKAKREARAK